MTGLEMQQQLMDETRLQRAKAEQPKFVRTDARQVLITFKFK